MTTADLMCLDLQGQQRWLDAERLEGPGQPGGQCHKLGTVVALANSAAAQEDCSLLKTDLLCRWKRLHLPCSSAPCFTLAIVKTE